MSREVRLLGALLGQVIAEQAGPELFATVERLRRRTIALRRGDPLAPDEVAGERAQNLVGHEFVPVGAAGVGAGLMSEPPAGPGEVECQRTDLGPGSRPADDCRCLVGRQGGAEPFVGPAQQGVDLLRQRPAAGQARQLGRVRGRWWVVQQEHCSQARVLLQGC